MAMPGSQPWSTKVVHLKQLHCLAFPMLAGSISITWLPSPKECALNRVLDEPILYLSDASKAVAFMLRFFANSIDYASRAICRSVVEKVNSTTYDAISRHPLRTYKIDGEAMKFKPG